MLVYLNEYLHAKKFKIQFIPSDIDDLACNLIERDKHLGTPYEKC